MGTFVLWILVLVFTGLFAAQVATRVRLIAAAPNTFSTDHLGPRVRRFFVDVICQRQVIVERPAAGLAHAFVFWGFVAFSGYTVTEFLYGLGIVDLTGMGWFHAYRMALTPFAVAVLIGILYLLIRRAFLRHGRQQNPEARSPTRLRFNADVAAVMADDSIYRRETEACALALFLCRVERLEQVTPNFLGNSDTCVGDH